MKKSTKKTLIALGIGGAAAYLATKLIDKFGNKEPEVIEDDGAECEFSEDDNIDVTEEDD